MKEKIKFILLITIAVYFSYRAYKIYFHTPEIDFKNLQLKTLDNQKFSLQSKDDKSAIIIFFQTWCGPCVNEMKLIQKHFSEFNFTKIYLISDENTEKILSLKHRLKSDSLNFLHSEMPLESIDIEAFPTTYIIKNNKIIEKHKGTFMDENNFEDEIFHLKKTLE